jgi:hypothetical protein
MKKERGVSHHRLHHDHMRSSFHHHRTDWTMEV